ncbi:MAG: NAD-dependent DNA ligase LigA [Muribaculum sp.]|nr:NAD-dependent DNA ligase LigA [Muribaculum sp.]
MTIKEQIDSLRTELNKHNHSYYVNNAPTISDYDYDMLMKELEKLEKAYPEYDDELSPTHRVGSDITKGFKQVAHIHPMLSLGNTYTIEEVDDWVKKCNDMLGNSEGLKSIPIVGEMKFDGTSISLIYENGRLIRAVTRGDGDKGDDVTENIKTIRGIPLTLHGNDFPSSFEIRGEIVLPWKSFDKLNEERALNEEPLFANPRNAAAGTLKTQNSAEVSRRGLDAYFYYLLSDNLPCDNHYDDMLRAREWGFKVSDAMTLLHSIQEVDDFIKLWDDKRKQLPVATDGLVFKVNNLRQQLNLGYTSKSPRWAIAYKFAAERALTKLRFVSFEVGRMGIITPVANLEPVLLSGTIVKRASLYNEDAIKSLGIHEHDMLYVEKGGEIIPKITGVDEDARESNARPVTFVTHCPDCGTPLIRIPGEASWMCPNKYGCRHQILGRIEHFVSRNMMDIEGLGEENCALLYDSGIIKDTADLYGLKVPDLIALDRIGPRLAQKIVEGIEASKTASFDRVIFALSIPFVGETVARKLARGVKNIDKMMSMSRDELVAIEDIGPRIADAIIEYFANPHNKELVNRLREAGLQMEIAAEETEGRTDLLAGKTIVISGVFAKHSREEYKELIDKNGGKNTGSISKKTDYVLAGDNMGPSKLEKAKSLGIQIINEDEFLQMIGQ